MPLQPFNQHWPRNIFAIWPESLYAYALKIGGIDTIRVNQTTKQKSNSQPQLVLLDYLKILVFFQNFLDQIAYTRHETLGCEQL